MTKYSVFLENPVSVNNQFFDKIMCRKGFKLSACKDWKDLMKWLFVMRIPKSESKVFKEAAQWKFKEARIPQFDGKKKVVFEVTGIWPDRRKRDLSNFSKPVLDAFKELGLVPDDNVILWQEKDWWIEKGVYGLNLRIYESELAV